MSKKTVFIIGAGASKEVNFPTNDELKYKIGNSLNIEFNFQNHIRGDRTITDALRIHSKDQTIGKYIPEAHFIYGAMPLAISIDNFIHNHRDNKIIELCGKLGIVRSILEAEKKCDLYFEEISEVPTINFGAIQETWYIPFFKLIAGDCSKEELSDRFESIILIIFNYDRCIEHFLHSALRKTYKLEYSEASDLVNKIKIYHPYGKVGDLPWGLGKEKMKFGSDPEAKDLLSLSDKIKTFTEGSDPKSSQINEIKDGIRYSDRLVFLGFGYNVQNMELISTEYNIDDFHRGNKSCFGTTKGISESDSNRIKSQISTGFKGHVNIYLQDKKCFEFLNYFSKSLIF